MRLPAADTTGEIGRALKLIGSADLPHPDGPLLECFVQESVEPLQAARYVLQRCSPGTKGLDLEPLLSEWKQLISAFTYRGPIHQLRDKVVVANVTKRDRGKCCITRLANSFWDPLVVVPLRPTWNIQVPENLRELLNAFLGSDLRDWILSKAPLLNTYENHWLVRKSAAAAFLEGCFQFEYKRDLEYSVSVVMIGGPTVPSITKKMERLREVKFANDSCVESPDASALEILSRFARPIRWSFVAREIANKKPMTVPRLPLASLWHGFWERALVAAAMAWRLVPVSLRIRAYYGLAFLGTRMYGPSCSMNVQRLPFGMYVKVVRAEQHRSIVNECAAIELVRRHTNIPVPRVLDLALNTKDSCLLTTRLPGDRLGAYIDTLTDSEVTTIVCDIQNSLTQLRAIPKEVAPEYAICNTFGGACFDYRINAGVEYDEARGDFIGPFVSEEEFNNILRPGALPNVIHRSGHKIVFTHGDLNMRNVLVHNGKFSGFVDWENSGWYPEYWDYTKAHYITKVTKRWLKMMDKVAEHFGGYESELAIEFQLWHYCF